MGSVVVGWMLALLLGVRHASEPDHLAAVSTLLAEQPDTRRGAALGAYWGVGHTLSLLAFGGSLFVLHLRMPARVGDAFELGVALMLLVLGARSLLRAARSGRAGAASAHAHGARGHVHAGARAHVHVGSLALARRPLAIGLVHGMAGSGALTALALANMPSLASGLVYMVLFGVGSIAGMALLAGTASRPLRALAQCANARRLLGGIAGTISLALGAVWGWPLLCRLASP